MKITLTVDADNRIGTADKKLYGGFVEHLGRNVYGGVYDPTDPTADEEGLRTDVLDAIRDLDTPITRYHGGCFSSSWVWKDGVGKNRPVRLDPYWKQLEPNTFGLDEFMKWARKANTEPLLTVNLGLGTVSDAAQLIEYCNFPSGTTLSDARRANAAQEPYHIRWVCLGNEQYGIWEYGHAPAAVYAQKARECVKIIRALDPEIKFILCGSAEEMQWNREVLEICYDYVDYLSLHFGFCTPFGDAEYFGLLDKYAKVTEETAALCEEIRRSKKSAKPIGIAVDEWIIWDSDLTPRPGEKWTCGMHLLEQDYVLRDVLLVGGLFSLFHNHADKIKLACVAQSVNVISPLRTDKNGVLWKQGTFHPFYYASHYGRGDALRVEGGADALAVSAVRNEAEEELTLFLTNFGHSPLETLVQLRNFVPKNILEAVSLTTADETRSNTADQTVLAPNPIGGVLCNFEGKIPVVLPARSWNCIRIKLGKQGND